MVGTQWKAQRGGAFLPRGYGSLHTDPDPTIWIEDPDLHHWLFFYWLTVIALSTLTLSASPSPLPPPWVIFISVIFLMSSCYSRVIILPSPSSSGVFIFVIVLPSPSSLGALTGG